MAMTDDILIYIVNFNTTKLTNDCIQSILSNVTSFDPKIVIFDNSTTEKFVCAHEHENSVSIIDNTTYQIIDFDKVLKDSVDYGIYKYYQRLDTSCHGTLKHSYTIDHILKTTDAKKMLLFDSDTILLRDIDFISDEIVTAAGTIDCVPGIVTRFAPFV